jgi:hypothetical protein
MTLVVSSMKGIAIRTVVFIVIGLIVVALALYFLYSTFISHKNITESDCKAIFSNQCVVCIITGNCKLESKIASKCNTILSNLGIKIEADGSFDKNECKKLSVGECGKLDQPCCYNNFCIVGNCDMATNTCK